MEDAYPSTGYVMRLPTVLMVLTKTKQHVAFVPTSFSAQMGDVLTWKMFVMERTTVKITATKIKSVSVRMKHVLGRLHLLDLGDEKN